MLTDDKKSQLEDLINHAEANGESPDFIQNELVTGFKKKYDTPEPQAAPEAGNPSLMQALGPRSYNAAQEGRGGITEQIIPQALDLASLPGRGISAFSKGLGALTEGKSIPEAYNVAKQDAARIGADPNAPKYQQIVEDAVKSPATLAMLPMGGPGAGLAEGLLFGAKTGATVAATNQAENVAAGKDINPLQAAGDVALGTATGGVLPGLGKLGKGVLELPRNLVGAANRIENRSVKIGAAEAKSGAKPEYFAKYELFGKPQEVADNARTQIQDAASQLKDVIGKASEDPKNNANIVDVIAKTQDRALEGTTFGRAQVRKATNEIFNDLLDKYGDNIENMSLVDAQLLKREAGKMGDWYESPMGGKAADNSNIKSHVYNTLYDELKTHIENTGGPEVQALNKKMSELIPMERAAAKRALVSQRNNPISLDDYIGGLAIAGSAAHGNLAPAIMAGANMASKSPNVAMGLYGLGSKLGGLTQAPMPTAEEVGQTLGSKGASIADALKRKLDEQKAKRK